MTPIDSTPASRRSESGSAYLATMLVLVVLTMLGLSLAVITQTEVLISGSEKQAARQLFASSSGVHEGAVYQIVSHDGASHRMRIAQRNQNVFGQTTVIADDVCTTSFTPISSTICDLCKANDPDYEAKGYAVTSVALRRGDAALGARKTVGAITTLDPWPVNDISGLQMASDVSFRAPADPTIDIDPSSEVDPCEGIYLKF